LFEQWALLKSSKSVYAGDIICNKPGYDGFEDSMHGGHYYRSISFELPFAWDSAVAIDAEHALVYNARTKQSAILNSQGQVLMPENGWILQGAEAFFGI
jgi:hypothetical protein